MLFTNCLHKLLLMLKKTNFMIVMFMYHDNHKHWFVEIENKFPMR